jgi:hypothetical protein
MDNTDDTLTPRAPGVVNKHRAALSAATVVALLAGANAALFTHAAGGFLTPGFYNDPTPQPGPKPPRKTRAERRGNKAAKAARKKQRGRS